MEKYGAGELFYDYAESDSFRKSKKIHELREEMSDYPKVLSVIDLFHYAPYELRDGIGEAVEAGSLASTFSNGEEMVKKEDFILWCAEKMIESYLQPLYLFY
ncbi:hypothetical protein [Halanaerobium salsuginis]|uniref:Uncharacterized protein n=1 Tax=Halanaerobium salsuginis TaxID=29563 RepID=A0A1I4FZP9_9FIRM|nr:hypothetical protein [Halanaerobium salsuginis]SFL22943.1 hypothetical protein SAMN02983006_00557 [Halanaerobium salsuginis]